MAVVVLQVSSVNQPALRRHLGLLKPTVADVKGASFSFFFFLAHSAEVISRPVAAAAAMQTIYRYPRGKTSVSLISLQHTFN